MSSHLPWFLSFFRLIALLCIGEIIFSLALYFQFSLKCMVTIYPSAKAPPYIDPGSDHARRLNGLVLV